MLARELPSAMEHQRTTSTSARRSDIRTVPFVGVEMGRPGRAWSVRASGSGVKWMEQKWWLEMESGVRIQGQDRLDQEKHSPSSNCPTLKDVREKDYLFSCSKGMGIMTISWGS